MQEYKHIVDITNNLPRINMYENHAHMIPNQQKRALSKEFNIPHPYLGSLIPIPPPPKKKKKKKKKS